MWRNVILLLCVIAGTRQLSINEFNVPDAVELGESAELQCHYELKPGEDENLVVQKWWFSPLEGNQKKLLYQKIGGRKEAVLRKDIAVKEPGTILLNEVKANDSGTYECEVELTGGEEIRKKEELIAYTQGSGPNLTFIRVADGPDEDEEEDVVIHCEASDVAPLPELSITVNKLEINITEENLDQVSDKPGLYSISVNATVSKSNIDGNDVACELFYKNSNISHPEYVDIETFDPSGKLTTTEASEDDDELTSTMEPDEADGACSIGLTYALVAAILLAQLFILQ